jgi:phosphomannomutase
MVISESMSYNIERIVESYGGGKQNVLRVRDQAGSIAQAIRENQGIFGASDTGSYWAPSFTVDADGIYTSLKLLEMLSDMERPLSRYLDTLPQLPNNHRELVVPENNDNAVYWYLEYHIDYPEELGFRYAIDTLAGTKLVFEHGWVNTAPSSKDPQIVHLTSESEPFQKSNDYLDAVQNKIDEFSKSVS